MSLRIGVDEAGKGPALGPMVAGAVAVPSGATLPDGVADSKAVPADSRERLAADLRASDVLRVAVTAVGPARIDAPETDMNSLTVAAHATVLREALDAADATRDGDGRVTVVLDGADVDPDRFARRVADAAGVGSATGGAVVVRAEHGADETHAVVGAASVVAKAERDARMATVAADHDRPVGSGYPGDPTTRAFLREYVREHGALPPSARESWQTCRDVLAAAEQSGLEEF